MKELHGVDVLLSLAEVYQQLYIPPGEDCKEQYDNVVKKGHRIPNGNLCHFAMDERDSLVYEDTPAGKVCVITLYNRRDFVTFLQIMANRCEIVDIPDTQGASIIDGVANWEKIRAHKDDFYKRERGKGNLFPDWKTEFARFTAEKSNYIDALIVLSVGPYSGISADRLGLSDDEWMPLSHTIRKYHECTHFICRRKYPDKIDTIYDELVADTVGIYAAFGRFDPKMEELFLGIENGRYIGGRLGNYVTAEDDTKKREKLESMTPGIIQILERFEELIEANSGASPYGFAIVLQESNEG